MEGAAEKQRDPQHAIFRPLGSFFSNLFCFYYKKIKKNKKFNQFSANKISFKQKDKKSPTKSTIIFYLWKKHHH